MAVSLTIVGVKHLSKRVLSHRLINFLTIKTTRIRNLHTACQMAQKYIVDVDTGVDDAHALILALSKPDIQVLGVTCVAGNCSIDQVCLNTLKVLTVCDRLDVPVYKGASTALVGEGLEATHYHGSDGLGDANLDIPVSMDQLQKEHAVAALVRLVNQHPGEITLVALAPLTNIAMAIRQDPDFGKKLKSITIMGGNVEARGRISMCAEFNFYTDPEAAFVVLQELSPINLLPYENRDGPPWDWFDKWVETDTKKGRFNRAILQVAVHKQREVRKMPIFRSCDLNAMVTVVDPDVVMDTQDVFATVELQGKYTRGMMVVDWNNRLGREPNVRLIRMLDTTKARVHFDQMML